MCIELKRDKDYRKIVDLLSRNKEASKIYLDICNKNDEIDGLLDRLKRTVPSPEFELMVKCDFFCDLDKT